MSVEYLDVEGITDTAKAFRDKIYDFDNAVVKMNTATAGALRNWAGKGRNQFETQMKLMEGQLKDITDMLYDIYDALVDAEKGYIDEDEEVAKQFTMSGQE